LRVENFRLGMAEPVIVPEGRTEFEIGCQARRPQVGEELLVPAGARHAARKVGSTTACWLCGYRLD
jgi:hypothetical protein